MNRPPAPPRAAARSTPAPAARGDAAPGSAVAALSNGVRIVTCPMPGLRTAGVGVFVRSGSAHEARANNGISHVLEHMAFKGTAQRDVVRVNLDAERLGAEVNAHTDKDHTAYYMHGLGADAPAFVPMLADIVRHATFPADELAREREVILQEVTEVEDDPVTVAYQLFDHACWGLHPAALPVIGQRRHIERFTRDDLVEHVARQYTGANVVVAAAGDIDAAAIVRDATAAFGDMPAGHANTTVVPAFAGGVRTRRMAAGRQIHLVMGFPIAASTDADPASELAAAVLGDGMSSPLLGELREKRGLVYHAACSADRFDFGGQLAIEASFAPEKLDEVLGEVVRLLRQHADRIDQVDLERARKQLAVRLWRDDERAARRMETAALDLFGLDRVRSAEERLERLNAVGAGGVREAFESMLKGGAALAVTGNLPRGVTAQLQRALAPLG